MARLGLQRGFNQGRLQGVKTGFGMSNQKTGYASGLTDGTANMDKMQDPLLLTGAKTPLFFCNADNYTFNNVTITLTDLIGSGYALTNAQGGSFTPDIIEKDIFNLRNGLDFNNAAGSLYPTPSFSGLNGKNAYSIMMVVKLKPISSYIIQVQDLLNPGSLILRTTDTAQTIQSTFYGGQPGALTTSVYQASGVSQTEIQNYMILTFKGRIAQPGGAGSEQEVHINGSLKKQLVSSNFNIITTAMTSTQTFVIGNDKESIGSAGNGIYLGAFLMTDYWLNETEQLRLENYFRDYYGYKF